MLKPITSRLQFRLTLGYVFLSTLLLAGAGMIFRGILANALNNNIRENVDHDWAAMKGVLNIMDGKAGWFYDREDPEEAYMVARLRRVYLLTDATGSVLQTSDIYASLVDTDPAEVRTALLSPEPSFRKVRMDAQGRAYLIRSGIVYSNDKHHAPYFVAIGRSLADNQKVIRQFTRIYVSLMAIMVLSGFLLCWAIRQRDDAGSAFHEFT